MNIKKVSSVLLATLLLASIVYISGCATTGRDRSVDTSESIQAVDKEVRKMMVQIDSTGSALDALVMVGQPNLDKAFATYSQSLDKLESEGKDLMSLVDDLKAQKIEYFSEWEKQGDTFTNAEIRGLSETRRNELAKIYARVPEAAIGVKGSYIAYLNNLTEIKKYLSNDLTSKGVEAIIPVAEKSIQERETLKASFLPVLAALDEIKVELYSGKK